MYCSHLPTRKNMSMDQNHMYRHRFRVHASILACRTWLLKFPCPTCQSDKPNKPNNRIIVNGSTSSKPRKSVHESELIYHRQLVQGGILPSHAAKEGIARVEIAAVEGRHGGVCVREGQIRGSLGEEIDGRMWIRGREESGRKEVKIVILGGEVRRWLLEGVGVYHAKVRGGGVGMVGRGGEAGVRGMGWAVVLVVATSSVVEKGMLLLLLLVQLLAGLTQAGGVSGRLTAFGAGLLTFGSWKAMALFPPLWLFPVAGR